MELYEIKNVDPNSELKHERSNVMLDEASPILVNEEKGEIENMEHILEQNAEELRQVYNNRENLITALRDSSNRIVIVEQLENDMLWKPGIGGKNGSDVVVYISRSHPFYQYIYKELEAGEDALVILDALFLNLSMAEVSINATDRLLVKIFDKLRSSASLQLSRFIEVRLVQHFLIPHTLSTRYLRHRRVVVSQQCHRIASFLRLVLTKISSTKYMGIKKTLY